MPIRGATFSCIGTYYEADLNRRLAALGGRTVVHDQPLVKPFFLSPWKHAWVFELSHVCAPHPVSRQPVRAWAFYALRTALGTHPELLHQTSGGATGNGYLAAKRFPCHKSRHVSRQTLTLESATLLVAHLPVRCLARALALLSIYFF